MFPLWYYDLSNFNAKLDFLNMENDSASGASVYLGHILVPSDFNWVENMTAKRQFRILIDNFQFIFAETTN